MVGAAGLFATPALRLLGGTGLIGGGIGEVATSGGGKQGEQIDKQSEMVLIKGELKTLNTTMQELIENFNKKWIPAVVMSNVEGGRRSGKEVMKSLGNAQFG